MSAVAPHPQKNWRRRVLLVLAILLFLPVFVGLLGVGLVLFWYWPTLPEVPSAEAYVNNLPGVTRIYDAQGELLAEIAEEYREPVPFSRIPKAVVDALVATEDQHFFEHRGVDLTGMTRAMLENFRAGRVVQGGSTLTQQLAKTMIGSNERTFSRKAREFLYAIALERKLSKEEILTIYLNLVFFGEGAYGIQGAAKTYFSKNVEELSVAEAALLIGLLKAPSSTSPVRNKKKALERRNFVLRRMEAEKFITAEERKTAEDTPIALYLRQDPFFRKAPYPVESIRRSLIELYGEPMVLNGGLRVETTLSLAAQRIAENTIYSGLHQLDKRMGWRGAFANLASKKERAAFSEKSRSLYGESIDTKTPYLALVTKVGSQSADILLGDIEGRVSIEDMRWAGTYSKENANNNRSIESMSKALKEGDVVQVLLAKQQPEDGPRRFLLDQEPYIQGAVYSFDMESGYIVAYVAGRDYEESEFDRISQGCRQPGSTFKPIYYSLALHQGMSPDMILSDRPKKDEEADPEDEAYVPANVDGTYLIECSMRTALTQSRNVPSVELFTKLGGYQVVRWAQHLGFTTPLIADKALALGASCVHNADLAKVFAVFATNGRRVEPTLIKRVYDRNNTLILDHSYYGDPYLANDARLDRMISASTTPREQVIPAKSAQQIGQLLHEVVAGGLAWNAAYAGAPAAGKTGTSSRTADMWYIGYTSQFMTSVWLGSDGYERPLGADEQASHVAVPLWTDFMKQFLNGRPQRELPLPLTAEEKAQAREPVEVENIKTEIVEKPASTPTASTPPSSQETP